MQFAAFKDLKSKKEYIGIAAEDKFFEINSLGLSREYKDMQDIIENFSKKDFEKIKNILKEKYYKNINIFKTADVKILSPIKKTVHDIICAGFNYMDH